MLLKRIFMLISLSATVVATAAAADLPVLNEDQEETTFLPHFYLKLQDGVDGKDGLDGADDIFISVIQARDGKSITFTLADGRTFTVPIM